MTSQRAECQNCSTRFLKSETGSEVTVKLFLFLVISNILFFENIGSCIYSTSFLIESFIVLVVLCADEHRASFVSPPSSTTGTCCRCQLTCVKERLELTCGAAVSFLPAFFLSAAADGKGEITLCRRAVRRGQALSFEVRSEPG